MDATIMSRRNEKIVKLKKLGSSRSARREYAEFLCDGAKLLDEAVRNGAEITMVLNAGKDELTVPEGTPVYTVPRDIIESVSPMKNPQSVIFSCAIPEMRKQFTPGSYIVLENIQDPGNVGMIMRTANAFSMTGVILVGACADPYNPKAVRASMGAVFRQRVFEADYDELNELKANGMKIYGAYLGENCSDIRELNLKNAAVAIGSEGQGLTERMLSLCDETVIIPMAEVCESLNAGVAAAVAMWEMRRDFI